MAVTRLRGRLTELGLAARMLTVATLGLAGLTVARLPWRLTVPALLTVPTLLTGLTGLTVAGLPSRLTVLRLRRLTVAALLRRLLARIARGITGGVVTARGLVHGSYPIHSESLRSRFCREWLGMNEKR